MNFYKALILAVICFLSFQGSAQTVSYNQKRHFFFYGGVGPNYYFNNLVLAKDKVNEFNYSFSGRLMWEPEHRLSIGIESGYFRLYSMTIENPTHVRIANSAIPIQLVTSMKFLKTFYASFAIGRSILLNRVSTTDYGNFNANSISLADFSTSVGYKRQIKDRVSLGTEAKFYYASKANDKNIALLFMVGYALK